MDQIVPGDVTRFVLDLRRDFTVTPSTTKVRPPVRIDGVTIGHMGNVHSDADGRSTPSFASERLRSDE
jgi:hypothetical protein